MIIAIINCPAVFSQQISFFCAHHRVKGFGWRCGGLKTDRFADFCGLSSVNNRPCAQLITGPETWVKMPLWITTCLIHRL